MDSRSRRKTIVAVVTGVLVFTTIILAAEFGDTGASRTPRPALTAPATDGP